MKKYRITLTEEQLDLIVGAVEDWHRFLAGQCEMSHATSLVKDTRKAREALEEHVRPYIVPDLHYPGSAYQWDGSSCPNDHQRKAITMSYGIYREILHYRATHNGKKDDWNVYTSPTLTCEEQGPLIKIEEEEL